MATRRNEAGAVTAETATVLPVLVMMTAVLAWIVTFGVSEVKAVDAARETARALALGEDEATSTSLGRQVAPNGATIQIQDRRDTVVVTVRAQIRGPGRLLGSIQGGSVHAEAVAVREPAS